ncbi:MAG TPA: hypothetical protein DHV36_17185 [Desulfobacteraceae bacterium]|nr:hypothetical protein [Desulfobacteraceae bacterium]|tara:strand:- start:15 stop:281 length:267 start_codon:yes stop_codon:yes gene_type:complete
MKTIEVNIKAQFIVPDEWEVTDHMPDPEFPDDIRRVLKIEDQFYDFFPECLVKVEDPDVVIWSADEGRTEEIIDCMDAFQVDIREKNT